MVSVQTLSEDERRTVARWALACAERVVPLFDADADSRAQIRDAVERTRAYSAGEGVTAQEIRKRLVAATAAKAATTPAGAAAARSVAQASAVAHMGAHALGAAAYAAKAVALANPENPEAVADEIAWQMAQLADAERAILRQLPEVGTDSSGPLGPGLLATGQLGAAITELQARIGHS
ncbi:putative immunity protein [Gordonia crocea]|uniref:putative immunity protein n=1 Tax=Gordonia crocea TaxID=589162 RepID=UPI00137B287B|nr:hypothetical protein [Gordonia crocea]